MWYKIEIDDKVMAHLKKEADPFVDTPNSVLHKLLFNTKKKEIKHVAVSASEHKRTPRALSQTLEVIYEVVVNGNTRQKATRIVANRYKIATQTVLDKYCRQLGKRSDEIDMLLKEPGLKGLCTALVDKFPSHRNEVNTFIDSIRSDGMQVDPDIQNTSSRQLIHRPCTKPNTPSNRKKRNIELENRLKCAVGDDLRDRFGSFQITGQSELTYGTTRVICKYSSFHPDQSRWFWGVSKTYWNSWGSEDYLALILEDEDETRFSYVLLDSDETKRLLDVCSQSNEEKKINMRKYASDGLIRFQELQDFDLQKRIRALSPSKVVDSRPFLDL